MQQSKLFRLLRGLSENELKRFSRLLQSPFFNTNPTQKKLYTLLRKYYPNFDSPKLTKEKIYQKLYPGKAFHYHRMANLMSEMSRLVEEFLIQMEIETEKFQKQKLLVKALGRRNLYELFVKGTNELRKELDELPYRDTAYYQNYLDLMNDHFIHPFSDPYELGEEYSEVMMNKLDRYFSLYKFQLSVLFRTRKKIFSGQQSIIMIEPVLEHSQKVFSKENPLFAIYYNIYHLQDAQEETLLTETTKLLLDNLSLLRKKEQSNILWYLINYAIDKINKGQFGFNRKVLNLYKIGLQNGLLLEEGKMGESAFCNIVSAAGVLGEFEWTDGFIKNNEQYLEEDIRDKVVALSQGELKFRQKLFDAVISEIGDKHFSNILHQTKARNLLIKSWFEQFLKDKTYYNLLMAQIESFEKFIKRNKELSGSRAKAFSNFLNILRAASTYLYQMKFNETKKNKLLEKIENHKVLTSKVWLKNRIEQL